MYKPEISCFKSYFNNEDLIDLRILQIIQEMLGSPEDNEYFNTFTESINLECEDNVVGYQVRLTEDHLNALRKELVKFGINFDEKFKKDFRHFHITIVNDKDNNDIFIEIEDEGVAYEKEDSSWDVYYVEGSLGRWLGISGEFFAFNIKNEEINNLEDVETEFKKWVSKQKNDKS